MKILHIAAGLPPGGGIAESVPSLCRHLLQLGHEVTLATLDGPLSGAAQAAEAAGVRLVRFAPSFPRALYFSWQMLRGLPALARAADVVHVHGAWTFPVWWGCCCALRAHKPLVMSPRGALNPLYLKHSAWKKGLVGWLDRAVLRRSAVIHATAVCERDWVRAYLGTCDVEIAVIPNGVEVREVLKCESSKALKLGEAESANHANRSNSAFSLQPSAFSLDAARTRTVLYLGRLHPLKGLDLLTAAWRQVVTVHPQWRLLIVGPDEQGVLHRLEQQAREQGLEQSVSFGRSVSGEEKKRLFAETDLFVLPTRSENFGIVVAEALACGIPVITTKGAPWQELENCENALMRECVNEGDGNKAIRQSGNQAFQPVRAGWWVDIGVEPLAEALREAMGLTDEERHAMGKNGRKLVESKYRWEKVAGRMSEVYERCVDAEMR